MKEKFTEREGNSNIYNGQTCLESFGIEARKMHLMRNSWDRYEPYTKPLVEYEYDIQQEFKISTREERLLDEARSSVEREMRRAEESAERRRQKEEKKAEKAAKKAADRPVEEDGYYEPQELTSTVEYTWND